MKNDIIESSESKSAFQIEQMKIDFLKKKCSDLRYHLKKFSVEIQKIRRKRLERNFIGLTDDEERKHCADWIEKHFDLNDKGYPTGWKIEFINSFSSQGKSLIFHKSILWWAISNIIQEIDHSSIVDDNYDYVIVHPR